MSKNISDCPPHYHHPQISKLLHRQTTGKVFLSFSEVTDETLSGGPRLHGSGLGKYVPVPQETRRGGGGGGLGCLNYLRTRFCLVGLGSPLRLDRRHCSLHPDHRTAPVTTLAIGRGRPRDRLGGGAGLWRRRCILGTVVSFFLFLYLRRGRSCDSRLLCISNTHLKVMNVNHYSGNCYGDFMTAEYNLK